MPTILPPATLRRAFQPTYVSRRTFLKQSLAAATGLLLSARSHAAPGRSGGRILVIGAGLAGLSCAFELRQTGFDVQVLEARSRVGGRAYSGQMQRGTSHVPVEFGGELIGSQHAAWGAYAQRFGLKLTEARSDETRTQVMLDGRLLDAAQSRALAAEVVKVCEMLNHEAAQVRADAPWQHPQAAQLDSLDLAHKLAQLDTSSAARRYLHTYFDGLCGVPVAQQSYLAHLSVIKGGGLHDYWSESERFRCEQGAGRLAEALAKAVGQEQVHLRTPIRALRRGADGVAAMAVDGRIFEGDAIVLALPPSVWSKLTFTPSLPAGLTPQMGDAVKYIVAPDAPFWGSTPDTHSDGPIFNTWAGPHQQTLVCFSGGSAASRTRAHTPQQTHHIYDVALQKLYPSFKPTTTTARLYVDWAADCDTAGGYSCPAPGQVTTLGPMLQQAHNALHFAGEHVSYGFWGYMEGALRSGAAVAARLAAA